MEFSLRNRLFLDMSHMIYFIVWNVMAGSYNPNIAINFRLNVKIGFHILKIMVIIIME